MARQIKQKKWSDPSLLIAYPNPSEDSVEHRIKCPEVTFLGFPEQPDFVTLWILMYPGEQIVDLRSLKKYFFWFRDRHISYERFIEVVYSDLKKVFKPRRLRIAMACNPRGGISSKLVIDSDWKSRGGKEQYKNWSETDTW